MIVVADPHVVEDFEATGLRLERLDSLDQEKLLLWLIDKSRDLDKREVDAEFARDFGSEIAQRTLGATFAEMVRKGGLRAMATRDNTRLIVQFPPSEELLRHLPTELPVQ
jgi:hypothetical protein